MLGLKSTPLTRDCKIHRAVNRNSRCTFFDKVFVICVQLVLFPGEFGTLAMRRDLLSLGVSTKNEPQRSNGCWG